MLVFPNIVQCARCFILKLQIEQPTAFVLPELEAAYDLQLGVQRGN